MKTRGLRRALGAGLAVAALVAGIVGLSSPGPEPLLRGEDLSVQQPMTPTLAGARPPPVRASSAGHSTLRIRLITGPPAEVLPTHRGEVALVPRPLYIARTPEAFEARVLPGLYSLSASAAGCLPARLFVRIAEEELELAITLERVAGRTITVVALGGGRVPGATLRVDPVGVDAPPRSWSADEAGVISIPAEDAAGIGAAVVAAPGHGSEFVQLQQMATHAVVVLRPERAVLLEVVDAAAHRPVAGARLLRWRSWRGEGAWLEVATSDARGLLHATTGVHDALACAAQRIEAPDFVGQWLPLLDPSGVPHRIVLDRHRVAGVTVVDEAGSPVAGARVVFGFADAGSVGSDPARIPVVSDRQGHALLPRFTSGTAYRVDVSMAQGSPSAFLFTASELESLPRCPIPRSRRVPIRIRSAGGDPLPGARVYLVSPDATSGSQAGIWGPSLGTSGPDGVVVAGLPGETGGVLVAVREGYVAHAAELSADQTEVELTLDGGVPLVVRVLDQYDRPVAGARVQLRPPDLTAGAQACFIPSAINAPLTQVVRTGRDGTAVLLALATLQALEVEEGGAQAPTLTLTGEILRRGAVEVRLVRRREIRLRVVDKRSGAGIPGVGVMPHVPGVPEAHTALVSDAEGWVTWPCPDIESPRVVVAMFGGVIPARPMVTVEDLGQPVLVEVVRSLRNLRVGWGGGVPSWGQRGTWLAVVPRERSAVGGSEYLDPGTEEVVVSYAGTSDALDLLVAPPGAIAARIPLAPSAEQVVLSQLAFRTIELRNGTPRPRRVAVWAFGPEPAHVSAFMGRDDSTVLAVSADVPRVSLYDPDVPLRATETTVDLAGVSVIEATAQGYLVR